MGEEVKIGATGEFPRGKLNQHDEGELALRMAADHQKGVVIVEFGTPVKWIGFDKKKAIQFADALRARAEEL